MKYNKLISTLVFGSILLGANSAFAQWTGPRKKVENKVDVKYGPLTPAHRTDKAMEQFRNYGLGQFIHWGLYAIPGNEWEGVSARKGAAASEWIRTWSGPTAPKDWKKTYDNLYKQFNPTAFDAKAWAKQAKDMGAKYLIFTTKHHDGFVLWQSRYTKHGVMSTGFRNGNGDVLKDLAASCQKFGLKLGIYLSPADLYQIENPDGLYGNLSEYSDRIIPRKVEGRPFKNNQTFKFNQITKDGSIH